MEKYKNIALVILVLGVLYFIYDKITSTPQLVEVPVVMEIPVPGKEGKIDTIYYPKPVKVKNPLNDELLKKYQEATDSISKLQVFKEATKIKDYKETFEDSVQEVTVSSRVQGTLLSQAVSYKIKPTTIKVDTVIKVPIKNKFKVFAGVEASIPTQLGDPAIILKPTITLKNSKDQLLSVGFDSQKRVWLGFSVKL